MENYDEYIKILNEIYTIRVNVELVFQQNYISNQKETDKNQSIDKPFALQLYKQNNLIER